MQIPILPLADSMAIFNMPDIFNVREWAKGRLQDAVEPNILLPSSEPWCAVYKLLPVSVIKRQKMPLVF